MSAHYINSLIPSFFGVANRKKEPEDETNCIIYQLSGMSGPRLKSQINSLDCLVVLLILVPMLRALQG